MCQFIQTKKKGAFRRMNEFSAWLDDVASRGLSLVAGVDALDNCACSNMHFNKGEYIKTANKIKFVLQANNGDKLVIPTRSRFVKHESNYISCYDVFPNKSKTRIVLVAVDCKTC